MVACFQGPKAVLPFEGGSNEQPSRCFRSHISDAAGVRNEGEHSGILGISGELGQVHSRKADTSGIALTHLFLFLGFIAHLGFPHCQNEQLWFLPGVENRVPGGYPNLGGMACSLVQLLSI